MCVTHHENDFFFKQFLPEFQILLISLISVLNSCILFAFFFLKRFRNYFLVLLLLLLMRCVQVYTKIAFHKCLRMRRRRNVDLFDHFLTKFLPFFLFAKTKWDFLFGCVDGVKIFIYTTAGTFSVLLLLRLHSDT